jgi:nitrous-oxide reductase
MCDEMYWHVTNLEQDWDVSHGFAIKGALTGELLIMPGETQTLKRVPEKPGMYPSRVGMKSLYPNDRGS